MTDFEFILLDKRKRSPLFRQLYEEIRDAIFSGRLAEGSRLPSSRYLAEQLGVSRTTVLTATDQLIAEGFVATVAGSGTFVCSDIAGEQVRFTKPPTGSTPCENKLPDKPVGPALSHSGKRISRIHPQSPGTSDLRPFQLCVQALDEFPIDLWAQILRSATRNLKPEELTYREPAGRKLLRESVARYLATSRGVKCHSDQVFIVGGTLQAVDIIARLFIDPGDQVLCENPGYVATRTVFESYGACVVPVPVDEQGAVVPPRVKNALEKAKLVALTPSHQFPLGVTMSIERRLEWIAWSRSNNCLVLEDDYDSEYRYTQKPVPALQGLDAGNRTLYVGSFSKVLFPGLSMAYLVVPERYCRVVQQACAVSSRPSSVTDQSALCEFISQGHFSRHLRRMRRTHKLRRDVFVERIRELMSDRLDVSREQVGLHCAARLLNVEHESDVSICQRLATHNISACPLSQYYLPDTPVDQVVSGLLLGFAGARPGAIKYALSQLNKWL